MGSSCTTCLNQPTPVVHPSSNHQGGFSDSAQKGSSSHLKKERLSSPKRSPSGSRTASPNKGGSRNGSPYHFRTDPATDHSGQEANSKKQRHNLFASRSFGESSNDSNFQSKSSNRSGRKKIRQEQRQVEVTTVQTIKETRIIHIEGGDSAENSRIDSLPTTTDEQTTEQNTATKQETTAPSADPTTPAYKVNNQPPVGTISREYFPLRSKTIPEELVKSNHHDKSISNKQSASADTSSGMTEGSILNKHASLETPYTRDCESPSPRYPRHASVATTSVVDSTVTEVDITSPTAMKCASQKLRMLLEAIIDGGTIEKATIIDTLSFAVSVLDHSYQQKKKSAQALDIEDSESFAESLSRATSVDNLVRDWLVSTFTRSASRAGGFTDDKNANKKNFKSVANVIRISIMVDRFRRSLYRISIPDNLKPYFKRFCYWDFDVFELHRVSGGHSLRFVCFEALSRFGVCTRFKIRRTVMEKFLNRLEEGYCLNRNPYHNVVHGADVTQGTIFYLAVTNLIEWLSELEIFTVIIASAIHDFEHTGTTNNFHINTKSDLALFYNDRSVLENYHVSAIFRLMAKETELNIFTGLTAQEYKEMRALLIEVVLNTDMQFHFAQVKNMRTTLSLLDADPSPSAVTIDKAKVLSLIVHSSDVSHPGRAWPLHLRWSKMLCQEFFNQGDREKALEMTVSPLCDRLTTNVASSQIGFIDFIVSPTFDVVLDMVERILNPLFLQHKARSSANILPTVDEGEENAASSGASATTSHPLSETEPLAGNEEYQAMTEDSGEPCEFIPFKWDARQSTLKLYRFYAKNIENNKVMWRKHIEDEVNDPMFFKRFERDPVIEQGWVFPEEKKNNDEKKDGDGSTSESELKKLKKDGGSEANSVADDREARKARRERHKQKLKQREKSTEMEGEEKGNGRRKSHKEKEKHHHKHRHHHKHQKESEDVTPVEDVIPAAAKALSQEQEQERLIPSDQESVVGDLLALDATGPDDAFGSTRAMKGDDEQEERLSDMGERLSDLGDGPHDGIAFDERDLDLVDDHDDHMTVKTDEGGPVEP